MNEAFMLACVLIVVACIVMLSKDFKSVRRIECQIECLDRLIEAKKEIIRMKQEKR